MKLAQHKTVSRPEIPRGILMKLFAYLTLILTLIGCSTLNGVLSTSDVTADVQVEKYTTKNNIHSYVERLTQQLFVTSTDINLDKSVAVSTFIPVEEMGSQNINNNLPNNSLGYQIQESFVTLVTQAGMKVTEFKTSKAIKIQNNRDLMLTRNVDELNVNISADYFLTGNYLVQEHNLVINARLIDVKNQQVIAAATDFIPSDIMWTQPKSIIKDGMLYRGKY